MNNRERMRASNKIAINWMLENGFDNIWLKPHGRRTDTHYCKTGNYRALDLFGLFDGVAWCDGYTVYLQIKTNAWANSNSFMHFLGSTKPGCCLILSLNVKYKRHGPEVNNRVYYKTEKGVMQHSFIKSGFSGLTT